jgi:hypothetical protein
MQQHPEIWCAVLARGISAPSMMHDRTGNVMTAAAIVGKRVRPTRMLQSHSAGRRPKPVPRTDVVTQPQDWTFFQGLY